MNNKKKSSISYIIATIIVLLVVYLVWFFFSSQPEELEIQEPEQKQLVDDKGPTIGVGLTLSPAFLNLRLEPGESGTAEFRVTNTNPIIEDLSLEVLKFQPDKTGKKPIPVDLTEEDIFINWLTFPETQFVLEPGETKNVTFEISLPEDARLGYYFAVKVGRTQEREDTEAKTVVSGAPLLPVLLDVPSQYTKKELSLNDFKTTQRVYEYLPADFEIEVENTGNVHVVPFGDIFIEQGGSRLDSILVNNTGGNILPESVRIYTTSWDNGFIIRSPRMEEGSVVTNDKGETVYETKWDFSKLNAFRIGRYTATMIFVYDDGERDIPIEAVTTFWVIPWKIMLGGLLIIAVMIIGVRSIIVSLVPKRKEA